MGSGPPDPAPEHTPVLLDVSLELLAVAPGGLYLDATLGLGGHTRALLERGARVLAVDRDPESIAIATARLADAAQGRLRIFQADYRRLLEVLREAASGPLDGIIADLGVSSYQLLSPERGFSFQSASAPLDMRMDRSSSGPTAAFLVNELDEAELARIIRENGEERDARRIARAIVAERERAPIRTTGELAALVARVKQRPGPPPRMHPATLTFQALRIEVNAEVEGLDRFVEDAVAALRRGGRLAIIAFHSLEDRPVKHTLRRLAQGCECPPELVVCVCGKEPRIRLLKRRSIRPSEAECRANPRARSARLRAAEKLDDVLAPGLGSGA